MRRPPLSTASISPRAAMKFGLLRTNRDGDDDGRVPRPPAGAIGPGHQNNAQFQAGGRVSRGGAAGRERQVHRAEIDAPRNARQYGPPARGNPDAHWLRRYSQPNSSGRMKSGPYFGADKAGDFGRSQDRDIFDSVMKGR